MKKLIIIILYFVFSIPSLSYAEQFPGIEQFQLFSGSAVAQPVADVGGTIVAVPFTIVGVIICAAATPFCGPSVIEGVLNFGLVGYMVGQQIGWPFYGIEKGIGWVVK